jgi:AAA15 family ATPase/GTPase
MSEHFIKNIEIKKFKCFKDFKAEGFGRVNLIGGKNNVGKTAFMEAIFIIFDTKNKEDKDILGTFITIENFRGMPKNITGNELKIINNKYYNANIKTNISVLKSTLKKDESLVDLNTNLSFTNTTYNFIPSYMVDNQLIDNIFNKIKKQRKRDGLNQILNAFDNNVLEFDIIDGKPQVFLKALDTFQNVSELGHGLKRYIAIIGAILINKNGILFLDELENGIHHSKLDKLWNIILTISKQQNVQVFATTHSKECIESYSRVAKKLEDEEIKFIGLHKLKDNSIVSAIRDYELLEFTLEQEHEVR